MVYCAGISMRVRSNSLSQRLNLVFGVFFIVAAVMNIANYGLDNFLDATNRDRPLTVVVGLLFVLLSRFDNLVIRYAQVLFMLGLSYAIIWWNDAGFNLAPYLLLGIALIAGHKLQLLEGRRARIPVAILCIAIALILAGRDLSDYTVFHALTLVNFVLAYVAILYFLFEDELVALRTQRDMLSKQALQLRPFAELGENIAGVVHDFKGDIAGIFALARIEKLYGGEENARKLLRYGKRLNERTNAILYIAGAHDQEEEEDIHVIELLRSATYYFAGVNRDLKHAVSFKLLGDEGATIRAHRSPVLVVFENIIKNSIEATEGCARREIQISVRNGQDHVVVQIRNSGRPLPFGSGKPIDVCTSQLFRRGRSGKSGGTGIGMVNVIRALKQLDGTMTMEDVDGGVLSTVTLPLRSGS